MYGNLKKILWDFYNSRHGRTQLSIKFISDIGKNNEGNLKLQK